MSQQGATSCACLFACFSSVGSLTLSVLQQRSANPNIFSQDSIVFSTIISNLFYKIIIINLLMHINIPQRENHDGILKMHLLLKCTQYMKMDGQRLRTEGIFTEYRKP